jgi:hypothetical protein
MASTALNGALTPRAVFAMKRENDKC